VHRKEHFSVAYTGRQAQLCVGLQDVVGKHMLKVEPLNAILDPHYFVRAVHECVMAVLKSHAETSEQNADRNAGHR